MLRHQAFCAVVLGLALIAAAPPAQTPVKTADDHIAANSARIAALSDSIWGYAELAFQEHSSSELLALTLEKAGFTVRRGVADMKTAFVAEYGRGRPVVAFLAEFDALPKMSQKAAPARAPMEAGKPGHACGHNLLGTASVAAALAVKEAIAKHKLEGKIVVYGTPAEEGGGGKVYMVREGLFKDVEAVIAWHPDVVNQVSAGGTLAVKRARFRFRGEAAHAALEPEKGRSALDAVELMNVGVNFLREHIPTDTRVHYAITKGGGRPNVVPEEAESWYYVRAPRMADTLAAFKRLEEIARGACLMTRTEVEIRDESGTYEVLPNRPLAELMHRHLRRVGTPAFDAADVRFAQQLRKNLKLPDTEAALELTIGEISTQRRMSSTDVGDVSWVVPTAELRVSAGATGTAYHTWPFAATAGSPIGHKACATAARVLAGSALELLTTPKELEPIRAEFDKQTKGFTYIPAVPKGQLPPTKIDE